MHLGHSDYSLIEPKDTLSDMSRIMSLFPQFNFFYTFD